MEKIKIKKSSIVIFIVLMLVFAVSFMSLNNALAENETQEDYYKYIYNFESKNELNNFIATIDPQDNSLELGYDNNSWVTYVKEDASDLFIYDEQDKTITSDRDKMSGNDSMGNLVSLLFKERKFTYFEIETELKHSSTDLGSGGITFGIQNRTRQPFWGENPNGGLFYVQGSGEPTNKYIGNQADNGDIQELEPIADFNGLEYHVHKLRVYKNNVKYYVDNVEYFSLTPTDSQISQGEIGVFATNKTITFNYIKINALNEDGTIEEIPESIEIVDVQENVLIAQEVEIKANVYPGILNKQYTIECDGDSNNYYIVDNQIVFKKIGEYNITVSAVGADDVTDTIKIVVASKYKHFNFSDNGISKFEAVSLDGDDKKRVDYSQIFTLDNEANSITRNSVQTIGVSDSYGVLYFKNNNLNIYDNFEIVFEAKSTQKNGWFGVFFGKQDILAPGNQEGNSLFMQTDSKKATEWGNGTGVTETDSLTYTVNEFSLYKIRVYGKTTGKIEMYVDNMATPLISKDWQKKQSGYVGLFASTTEATFKNVHITRLEDDGSISNWVDVESINIDNKISNMTVGDTLKLNILLLPQNASEKGFIVNSTNKAVLSISNSGLLVALSEGESKITITSIDDERIIDEFNVKIEKKVIPLESISISNKITKTNVGEKLLLVVVFNPIDADNQILSFESSDTDIAIVDADGNVRFIKDGNVTITAFYNDNNQIKDSFTVVVEKIVTPEEENNGESENNGTGQTDNENNSENETTTESTKTSSCSSSIESKSIVLFISVAIVLIGFILFTLRQNTKKGKK